MTDEAMTPKKWGRMLRWMTAAKGMTWQALADESGISVSALYQMKNGRRTVTVASAHLLATILEDDRLVAAAIEMRTKACEVCGAAYVDNARTHNSHVCGKQCASVKRSRQQRVAYVAERNRTATVQERRMKIYSEAVLAFCRACEPEGVCRDQTCGLRPVSPLRLRKPTTVRVA